MSRMAAIPAAVASAGLPLVLLLLLRAGSGSGDVLDSTSEADEGETSFLNGVVTLPRSYNKNVQPPGEPTVVDIGFVVSDVMEVDDDHYTITLKLDIPLYWNDSRIGLRLDVLDSLVHPQRWYYIDPKWKEVIWFPSFVISNLQEFETLGAIRSNEKMMITRIPDKRFYYMATHQVKFTCGLNFESFPFDEHECFFEVYFDNPVEELALRYFHGSAAEWGRADTTTVLSYVTEFTPLPEDRLLREHNYFSGTLSVKQSVAGFKLDLARKISVYVFNYYIPSGLFVVVSWVSLVIPPDAIPGRIALIITTFLVLVNIANTVFSSSPTADSINPIQVWILACIVFVFITVLEYTYILFLMRRAKKRNMAKDNLKKKKVANKVAPAANASSSKMATTNHSVASSAKVGLTPTDGNQLSAGESLANGIRRKFESSNGHAGVNGGLDFCDGDGDDDDKDGGLLSCVRAVSDSFAAVRSKLSAKLSPKWQKLLERAAPDEDAALQVLVADIDHAFVWIVIFLFLIFNVVYWNWYRKG